MANRAKTGDHTYQPDPPDLRQCVGKLADFEELSRQGANNIDAAYCILSEDVQPVENTNWTLPGFGAPDAGDTIGSVVAPEDIDPEGRIAKIGRTTGYTSVGAGQLAVVLMTFTIGVAGLGNVRFDDLIEVEWDQSQFATLGDSGALLYVEGSLQAVGLHMASGVLARGREIRHVSYACPLELYSSVMNANCYNEQLPVYCRVLHMPSSLIRTAQHEVVRRLDGIPSVIRVAIKLGKPPRLHVDVDTQSVVAKVESILSDYNKVPCDIIRVDGHQISSD